MEIITTITDADIHNESTDENSEVSHEDVYIYLCIFCDEQFDSSQTVLKHLSNEHLVDLVVQKEHINEPKGYSEAELESDESGQLPDKRDDPWVFDSYESDTDEKETDSQISTKKRSSSRKKRSPLKNRKVRSYIYKCLHCPKQYKSKGSLQNHRKCHEIIEKIKCRHPLCSKTFTSSSGYFHHMRKHNKEKQFLCHFCSKRFDQNCNLQVHIRRCHTLEKPFKCEYCQKAFASRTDRQVHTRVHTGEKPFECDICNRKFSTASKVTLHRRVHSEVRIYCCKKCNGKFSTRSLLYKHSLEHDTGKQLDCDVCGKRCRSSKTLMKHKQETHNEDRTK